MSKWMIQWVWLSNMCRFEGGTGVVSWLITRPDWLPSILSILTVELRWGKSGLNDLCWRRTMQRWKAQTERISKIYGCAGYGRKMDELWRMGSSTHQFHRCIGIQYWYSTYMSTGIYVYKYTSIGIPYQNARAVSNQSGPHIVSVNAFQTPPWWPHHPAAAIGAKFTGRLTIQRKFGTNRLQIAKISPVQIWVITPNHLYSNSHWSHLL